MYPLRHTLCTDRLTMRVFFYIILNEKDSHGDVIICRKYTNRIKYFGIFRCLSVDVIVNGFQLINLSSGKIKSKKLKRILDGRCSLFFLGR